MKYISFIFSIVFVSLGVACTHMKKEKTMEDIIDTAFRTAIQQYSLMAESLIESDSLLPRTYQDGKLVTSNSHWWCSGFFPGSLWYLYEYSKDDKILSYARQYTSRIEQRKIHNR